MGRTTVQWAADRLAVGPLEIAADEMSVLVAGQRVWLTRRELAVLMVLAERPGIPVSRRAIHERAWGTPLAGQTDRSVDVYVAKLRTKLAAGSPAWDYIHTHHNVGYRLAPEPRQEGS